MSIVENKDNKNEIIEKFATDGHSAIPIPVFAFGSGAENFTGYYENTKFVVKIKRRKQERLALKNPPFYLEIPRFSSNFTT